MGARSTNRREEIMNAAAARFSAQGFKKTTLDEIAGDVGIVKSALYKYFSNKEHLFEEMLEVFGQAHIEVAEGALAEARGVEDRLRLLLARSSELLVSQRRDMMMPAHVWRELKPLFRRATASVHGSFEDHIRKAIEEGVKAGEAVCENPAAVACMLHLAVDYNLELFLTGEISQDDLGALNDQLVRVLLDGMKVR